MLRRDVEGSGEARSVRPDELERLLRARLGALGPARRAEFLHVLMLPTSSGPTGSVSSGATHRVGPSQSS